MQEIIFFQHSGVWPYAFVALSSVFSLLLISLALCIYSIDESEGMYDSLPLKLGRKKYSCNFFRDFPKVIPPFDPTPTAECFFGVECKRLFFSSTRECKDVAVRLCSIIVGIFLLLISLALCIYIRSTRVRGCTIRCH
jgi:hypothetical protein